MEQPKTKAPVDVNKDGSYDKAKSDSQGRGYVWAEVRSRKPGSDTFVYIVPPQIIPYIHTAGPETQLNFLWTPKPDYCHLTLQFVGGSFILRNVHLTIAPGTPLGDKRTKLQVERRDDNGQTEGPTTTPNLVNDTVNDEKLRAAFRGILDAKIRYEWKHPILGHVGYLDPTAPKGFEWRSGAQAIVLQQCQAMLTELRIIMGDFGINGAIPNELKKPKDQPH